MSTRLGAASVLAAMVLALAPLGCDGETDAQDEAETTAAGGQGEGGGPSPGAGGAPPATGDGGGDAVDCAAAPVVTWASFGDAFATRHCTGCHSSTTVDRHGAPDGVDFDDKDTFLAYSFFILELVDRDADNPMPDDDTSPMPPGGGVDEDERTLLRTWLTCYLEADRAAE